MSAFTLLLIIVCVLSIWATVDLFIEIRKGDKFELWWVFIFMLFPFVGPVIYFQYKY